MAVKIENYIGTLDTFTFPYNPLTFDSSLDSNYTITPIGFQRHHILVSGGGINPSNIILTGHFSGTNRWTDYRNLSKHFIDNTKLKKLYFETDKFYLGVGTQLKKTHSGERTNFIDYVFSFTRFVGVLFGAEKTSGTNAGNTTTYVFEIEGDVDDGGVDVVLEDDKGNKITIDNSAYSTGNKLKYEFVRMIDSGSGIFVSEYGVVSIAGVQTKKVTTTTGFGLLLLDSGANITTVTSKITNLSNVTIKFRDGWAD